MSDNRELDGLAQVRGDSGLEHRVEAAVFERISEEEVLTDLGEILRGAVKATLELVLEEVLRDVVGAHKWARAGSRKDTYNGTYMRGLLTSMGHIRVAMPRARKGGAPVDVIGAYKRRSPEVDEAIASAYVHGVSTRKMARVVEVLTGNGVSSSTVSRVTKALEEKVEELRTRPLERDYPYLIIDGTYVKVRWARKVESVPALVAVGVSEDGMRELLSIDIGTEESELSWGKVLQGLIQRGLRGVQLVISDDHQGIKAAVRTHLPEGSSPDHVLRGRVGTRAPPGPGRSTCSAGAG